jgi:membrane-associated phospholipid phosphatase
MLAVGSSTSTNAQNPDIDILNRINNHDVSSATFKSMRLITNTNTTICAGVPIGLFAAGLIDGNREMKLKAIYMLEAMVISDVISSVLKYSIRRPRPFVTYPFIIQKSPVHSPSFPSGHASYAFSMATSLSIAYPKWYIIVPSMLYASTVGYSRMYLGVHYPSDIIAGAITGAGAAVLTFKINKWLHRSRYKSVSVAW